jgi:Domain of unknown function (DUF1883)/TIR domain
MVGDSFMQFDLGQQQRGAVVRITLSGNAANVRLLDTSNFSAYKSGRSHRYFGGLVRRSPVDLAIPSAGHWYVVVDMQGLGGQTRASVRVLPGPLPEFRQAPPAPLAPIREAMEASGHAAGTETPVEKEFDVFISHATEDKDSVVRPLAHALRDRGLIVWYDEFELTIGDSLRRKIDAGVARSRFGVVVLSHAFFAKNWPQYELDGLVTREMGGEQIILPLWHNISKDEIVAKSPSLADKVARRTSDATIEELAEEISRVISGLEDQPGDGGA